MSTESVAAALVTAGFLGVTHAIEPDHVAGISSLTSRHGDARLSALVGACFSVGHVALVVAWLAFAYAVLDHASFPAVYGTAGTVGAGILLGILGTVMATTGLRSALYEHDHGGQSQSHVHIGIPFVGTDPEHDDRRNHDREFTTYLKTGLVGALFTLSPPLSMIAFTSVLVPRYDGGVVALAVLVYTVTITATMSLIGAGTGAMFGSMRDRESRLFGVVEAVTGLLVIGLAVTMTVGPVGSLAL